MDWEEFVPAADPHVDLVVSPTDNPLTHEQYTLLCESFDVLNMCDSCNGVNVYCAVRQFVHDILSD